MATLFDYLRWRGDLSFSDVPPNEVDGLIFSMLSYMNLSGIVPDTHSDASISLASAASVYFAQYPDIKKISLGKLISKDIVYLFRAAQKSRRFRGVRMRAHIDLVDHKKEMQFSATTFLINGVGAVIAYRGTDDTLVGWKEDFNMCFMPEIPAQTEAAAYLNAAVTATDAPQIWVTGHSKGGNLAVWAAVHCNPAVKKRIAGVWCNDGPGFADGILDTPAYRETRPLIQYFVPQSTVVGVLMDYDPCYTVVKSRQIGIWQHDGMSWSVMGGSFVRLEDVTNGSKRFDRRLRDFTKKLTPQQRNQFVDALYTLITSNQSMTVTELTSWKNLKGLKHILPIDPQVRQTLQTLFTLFLEAQRKKQTNQASLASPKNSHKDVQK